MSWAVTSNWQINRSIKEFVTYKANCVIYWHSQLQEKKDILRSSFGEEKREI
jgi:hypothetical protein